MYPQCIASISSLSSCNIIKVLNNSDIIMVTIKMDRYDQLFKLCVGIFSFDSLSLSMVTHSMCRVAWGNRKMSCECKWKRTTSPKQSIN